MFASDKPDEYGIEQGIEWTLRPGPSNADDMCRFAETW